MRDIKFKCWCGISEKMLSDFDIEDRSLRDLDGDNDQIYLQYTGLKDKNGKEIYEGDIVKCSIGKIIINYPFLELWDKNNYGEEFQVVGNIYEN